MLKTIAHTAIYFEETFLRNAIQLKTKKTQHWRLSITDRVSDVVSVPLRQMGYLELSAFLENLQILRQTNSLAEFMNFLQQLHYLRENRQLFSYFHAVTFYLSVTNSSNLNSLELGLVKDKAKLLSLWIF